MKPMHGRWGKTGAFLVLGGAILSLSAGSAFAAAQTIDGREILSRIQRLERDLRDMQAETFRRTPEANRPLPPGGVPPPAPPPPAVEAPPPQPMPDLTPLMRRLTDLEDSLTRLTGQMEELGHRVDQLSQRTERLQKEMDFRAAQASNAPAMPDAVLAPVPALPAPPPGNAVASLAPTAPAPGPQPGAAPPSNLGQIPAGSALPIPAPPADPQREYDTAMNLLSRAQYDQASEAFRKYADAHPDEARAADALYWTGDIAYSAKKDYDKAAREFAELLKKYPTAQRAPEGMLKLGLALFELGQMREGCAALTALPARYPNAAAAVATRARNERRDRKCA